MTQDRGSGGLQGHSCTAWGPWRSQGGSGRGFCLTQHRDSPGGSWGGHPSSRSAGRTVLFTGTEGSTLGVPAAPPARSGGENTDRSPLHATQKGQTCAAPLWSGGRSPGLPSPGGSRAPSYLFLHLVLRSLFSTLFVPFVSSLAELHVSGAAHRSVHGAPPAQPGPKCQLLKEMP